MAIIEQGEHRWQHRWPALRPRQVRTKPNHVGWFGFPTLCASVPASGARPQNQHGTVSMRCRLLFNALLLLNSMRLYPLLFDCAAHSLLAFGRNRLGGDLSLSLVLHTW